jgi:hypothetical protein
VLFDLPPAVPTSTPISVRGIAAMFRFTR